MDDESKEKLALFIAKLRTSFYGKLEKKTGWGKEQLKLEFEVAIQESVIYLLQ